MHLSNVHHHLHRHVLGNGQCICGQVWNEEEADEEVLAMVARTGLRTTVGTLLRQVLNPMHLAEHRKDVFVRVGFTCHDDNDVGNNNNNNTNNNNKNKNSNPFLA